MSQLEYFLPPMVAITLDSATALITEPVSKKNKEIKDKVSKYFDENEFVLKKYSYDLVYEFFGHRANNPHTQEVLEKALSSDTVKKAIIQAIMQIGVEEKGWICDDGNDEDFENWSNDKLFFVLQRVEYICSLFPENAVQYYTREELLDLYKRYKTEEVTSEETDRIVLAKDQEVESILKNQSDNHE